MNRNLNTKHNNQSAYLLSMHSCTETFGVAFLDTNNPKQEISFSTFPIGRLLSNKLISCVEEIFPRSKWNRLRRISVAIGPGSFTSTRLTVAMARTLAQQLNCDLDGFSSFSLMAPRLAKELNKGNKFDPFWITKELPRRGTIAGRYQIEKIKGVNNLEHGIELENPKLIRNENKLCPSISASDNVESDLIQLLNQSLSAHIFGEKSNWRKVLPIYPTSPIDDI